MGFWIHRQKNRMSWYRIAQQKLPNFPNIQQPYLYHATLASRLPSIKGRGLDPEYEGIVKCWPDCEKGIYLDPDADYSVDWVETSDNPEVVEELYGPNNKEDTEGKIVVLEIKTSFLDKTLLDWDPNVDLDSPQSGLTYIYRGVIPWAAVNQVL
jgi:hypothetical protein